MPLPATACYCLCTPATTSAHLPPHTCCRLLLPAAATQVRHVVRKKLSMSHELLLLATACYCLLLPATAMQVRHVVRKKLSMSQRLPGAGAAAGDPGMVPEDIT